LLLEQVAEQVELEVVVAVVLVDYYLELPH